MDLKVKIITEADATAVRAYAKEVKGIATETAPASAEVKKLTPAISDSGKAAGLSALKKKDYKDAIKGISQVVPELGAALLLLKNPYVGAALGAATLIGLMIKQAKAAKEAADALDDLVIAYSAAATAAASWRTTAAESAISGNEHADSLARIKEQADNAEEALGKLLTKQNELRDQQDNERAAKQEQEKAAVNADFQTGAIDEGTKIQRLAAIDTRFGKADQKSKLNRAGDEVEAIWAARNRKRDEAAAAGAALPGAEAEAKATAAAEIKAVANRKTIRDKLLAEDKELDKGRKQLEVDATPQPDSLLDYTTIGGIKKLLDPAKVAKARAELERRDSEIKGNAEKRDALDAEDKLGAASVKTTADRVADLRGRASTAPVEKLDEQLKSRSASLNSSLESDRRVDETKAGTRQINDNAALLKLNQQKDELIAKLQQEIFEQLLKKGEANSAKLEQLRAQLARASEGR